MTSLPLGIVGLNYGTHVINDLIEDCAYFRVAAVCDIDRVKAESMGRRLGVKAYTDIESLLADQEIPVLGLFTPPNDRASLLHQILRAGKDVMTTKPFELDPIKAASILREAVDLKRVIHLNSPAPAHSPDFEQIARWREQYDLGRPVAARADIWVSYREQEDGSWQDDPARCPVAPVFRLGIYLINDLVGILGAAESVQVMHSKVFTNRPTPDNAQLSILFKNGSLANIYASFCVDDAQAYRNSLTLNFDRGTIYRNVEPSLADGQPVEMVLASKEKTGKPIVIRQTVSARSGHYQWPAFHYAIQHREVPSANFSEQVVEGLRILAAMTRAERSGCTEKV